MIRTAFAFSILLGAIHAQESKPAAKARPLSGVAAAAPKTKLLRFSPAGAPELVALDQAIAADATLAKALAAAFTIEDVALDTEAGADLHRRMKSPARGTTPGLAIVDRAGELVSVIDATTWKNDGKWDVTRIAAFVEFWSKPLPASDRLAKVKAKYGLIYDPAADAMAALDAAIAKAKQEGKHVLVKIGGNWCPWCYFLHDELETRPELGKLVESNYVLLRVNWDQKQRNDKVMERLDQPGRFGFPVLVVLDGEGKRLHTQDSGLLESGDRHDPRRVAGFLRNWAPAALLPQKAR